MIPNRKWRVVFDTADTDLPTLEMLVAELVQETKDINPITTVPQLESKVAAEYTDVSPEYPSVCANCKFYRGVGKCSIVEGHISPAGWCKHYDAKPVDPTEPYEDRTVISEVKAFTAGDTKKKIVGLLQRGIRETIDKTVFESELLDLLAQQGTRAYLQGMRDGGNLSNRLDQDDQDAIENFVISQIDYIDGISTQIFDEDLDESVARQRAAMWVVKSVKPLYWLGLAKADGDSMRVWILGETEEHCEDCSRLANQIHSLNDWIDSGYLPQGDLACGGFNCLCDLKKTKLPEQGEY